MNTYDGNGVCDYISMHKSKSIYLTDTSKSILVVAEKEKSKPLFIVLDDRVGDVHSSYDESEIKAFTIGGYFAKQSGLPFIIVRYKDKDNIAFENREIALALWNKNENTISKTKYCCIDEFVRLLNTLGIKAEYENRTPDKKQNDKLSSDFHLWQREKLKVGIFTDVDMLRYDEANGKIKCIYELKRSVNSMDTWKPFLNDKNNYSILANMCELLKVPLVVVFNNQSAENSQYERLLKYYFKTVKDDGRIVFDNIIKLKLFQIYKAVGGGEDELVPVEIGTTTIDSFVEDNEVKVNFLKYWNTFPVYEEKIDYICYCDPNQVHGERYGNRKFYHLYPDCDWIDAKADLRIYYEIEAQNKGYKYLCNNCKNRKTGER